jgi:hypothetical protein
MRREVGASGRTETLVCRGVAGLVQSAGYSLHRHSPVTRRERHGIDSHCDGASIRLPHRAPRGGNGFRLRCEGRPRGWSPLSCRRAVVAGDQRHGGVGRRRRLCSHARLAAARRARRVRRHLGGDGGRPRRHRAHRSGGERGERVRLPWRPRSRSVRPRRSPVGAGTDPARGGGRHRRPVASDRGASGVPLAGPRRSSARGADDHRARHRLIESLASEFAAPPRKDDREAARPNRRRGRRGRGSSAPAPRIRAGFSSARWRRRRSGVGLRTAKFRPPYEVLREPPPERGRWGGSGGGCARGFLSRAAAEVLSLVRATSMRPRSAASARSSSRP